jgi:hypothetical protein
MKRKTDACHEHLLVEANISMSRFRKNCPIRIRKMKCHRRRNVLIIAEESLIVR